MRVALSDGHELGSRPIFINMFPVFFLCGILQQRHGFFIFIYLGAESSDCTLTAGKEQGVLLNKSRVPLKWTMQSDGSKTAGN